jgi:ABC-2 type transport system ATP-binding protein
VKPPESETIVAATALLDPVSSPPVLQAPVLSAEGVTKSYGALKALDRVSLQVQQGEFVALLGPNGAGKTTLFQLLTGFFVADEGRIAVAGYDIGDDPVSALKNLGVVFQQATLDLDLSIESNLRFHARLQGMDGAEAVSRIDEELTRSGLSERRAEKARIQSGGNRRKIELARALLTQPRVLLMDEPTVGLDPASRRDLLAHMRALKTNAGILWATHLVEEAEMADRVIILHRGKILREGRPADLVRECAAADLNQAFLILTAAPALSK